MVYRLGPFSLGRSFCVTSSLQYGAQSGRSMSGFVRRSEAIRFLSLFSGHVQMRLIMARVIIRLSRTGRQSIVLGRTAVLSLQAAVITAPSCLGCSVALSVTWRHFHKVVPETAAIVAGGEGAELRGTMRWTGVASMHRRTLPVAKYAYLNRTPSSDSATQVCKRPVSVRECPACEVEASIVHSAVIVLTVLKGKPTRNAAEEN